MCFGLGDLVSTETLRTVLDPEHFEALTETPCVATFDGYVIALGHSAR